MRMAPGLVLVGSMLGCRGEPPVDGVVSTGFDGVEVPGRGWWVQQRLWWVDGSHPDETEHLFVLTNGPSPCERVLQTTPDTGTRPEDPVAACEYDRDQYARWIGALEPDTLTFELSLWSRVGEPHIAIEPVPGRYSRPEPETDPLPELFYTFYGDRVLFDWPAAVAEDLDCAAAEPWADVPSQSLAAARFENGGGTFVLDEPEGDVLPFELRDLEVVWDDGGESEGGVLDGVGVFEVCHTERAIEPSDPID